MKAVTLSRECLSSHHSPFEGVVEPLQELDGGALSAAAATHQGQSFSLAHLQIQPLEDGYVRAGGVVKLNILKANITVESILEFKR